MHEGLLHGRSYRCETLPWVARVALAVEIKARPQWRAYPRACRPRLPPPRRRRRRPRCCRRSL